MIRRRTLLGATAGLLAAPAIVEKVGAQSAFDWKQCKGQKLEVMLTKGARGDLLQQHQKEFEELTGIRGAQGEVIDTVSRDESFPALLKEMVEKSLSAGNEGIDEDYDFPSGQHRIHAVALAGVPGRPESYLFLFQKQGD